MYSIQTKVIAYIPNYVSTEILVDLWVFNFLPAIGSSLTIYWPDETKEGYSYRTPRWRFSNINSKSL